ncbi:MAG: hypothetical protein EOP45_18910 [Sphingobacteriaceae bacterium]|nr:MAG: hypothetical protein EOP45_18910 [Sphingobacteriaceae bacterium]
MIQNSLRDAAFRDYTHFEVAFLDQADELINITDVLRLGVSPSLLLNNDQILSKYVPIEEVSRILSHLHQLCQHQNNNKYT